MANAILDGTDAVMLSEETAAGQYPVEAVEFLDRVSRATEENFPHAAWLRSRDAESRREISEAVSHAACEMALDLEAAAILTNTDGGGTARLISRFRPQNRIIALTSQPETLAPALPLLGRFAPVGARRSRTSTRCCRWWRRRRCGPGCCSSGDRVIITAGTPIGTQGTTNLIKAATIK